MPLLPIEVSLVGKILKEDIWTPNGSLLLTRGTTITMAHVQALLRNRIDHVQVYDAAKTPETKPQPTLWPEEIQQIAVQLERLSIDEQLQTCYLQALDETRELFERMISDSVPSFHELMEVCIPVVEQSLQKTELFRMMYLLEGINGYTYRHSVHVSMLAALIARLMRMNQEEIKRIGQAGFLHDVGKLFVPKDILMKPGRLTESEYEVMKTHTIHGYELLSQIEGASPLLALCALMHHERLNGSGYPIGMESTRIPLACQIVAVADVFDAICSDRVYKDRRSPFTAAQLLWREACEGRLNIEVVTTFIHYIVTLYAGCRALLNNGEEVEVVFIHKDEPMRPLVRRGEEFFDLRANRLLEIDRMIS